MNYRPYETTPPRSEPVHDDGEQQTHDITGRFIGEWQYALSSYRLNGCNVLSSNILDVRDCKRWNANGLRDLQRTAANLGNNNRSVFSYRMQSPDARQQPGKRSSLTL